MRYMITKDRTYGMMARCIKGMMAIVVMMCLCVDHAVAQGNNNKNELKVGVVLPLKEASQRGQKMVEFYQGLLMAVDSIRKSGVSVDVVAAHSGSTEADLHTMLHNNDLSDRDVVFGPLDGALLPILSDYCNRHDIRLVVPFTPNMNALRHNPKLYIITAPRAQVQAQAVDMVSEQFSNSHFVFVNAKEQNEEGQAMETQLRTVLSNHGAFMRSVDIDAEMRHYEMAFNPLRHNVVVVNSSSMRAANSLLFHLHEYQKQHPECRFVLLGYPTWQTFNSTMMNDFHNFDTYIYTTFFRNPNAPSTHRFDHNYQHWFKQPMQNTFPRWGMMGFDAGWFFLRGLSLYGNLFDNYIATVPSQPFQSPMQFALIDNNGSGFLNIFVELVHYTKNQTIEVLQ